MIPQNKLKEYMETNVIQIAPLAFMRGRTLNDAVIILDEAQNTTTHQIKMFLTRLGMNAKMIITGDITQIDLPHSTQSGLIQALKVLDGVKGIGKVQFEKKKTSSDTTSFKKLLKHTRNMTLKPKPLRQKGNQKDTKLLFNNFYGYFS